MAQDSGRERAGMAWRERRPARLPAMAIAAAAALLAACQAEPGLQQELAEERRADYYGFAEESILDLFAVNTDPERTIAVNRYLWQASLDTLSFLPLEGADPFSGLIVTDWGAVPGDGTPYRVTVMITEPALDARALRVAAFRQQGGRSVPVAVQENRRLEDAILTRARQIRIAEAGR